MAHKKIIEEYGLVSNTEGRQRKEAELILLFKLTKIVSQLIPLMAVWLDVQTPKFDNGEQYLFNKKFKNLAFNISGWNEEDLKMKFIIFS